MEEIFRVADRITVLRDGRRAVTEPLRDRHAQSRSSRASSAARIERRLSSRDRARCSTRRLPLLLEVRALHARPRVRGVSTSRCAPGRDPGLAGLMGSGRTELARALFGIDRIDSGEVRSWPASRCRCPQPEAAIAAGIALIPEDRREQGLVLDHSVRDNLLLPLLGRIRMGPLLDRPAGRPGRRTCVERFGDQDARHRTAGSAPLRRQPAEGRPRQVAGHRARRPHHGRAHRRRRHRHQERDRRHDPRPRRRRQGRHRHLLGATPSCSPSATASSSCATGVSSEPSRAAEIADEESTPSRRPGGCSDGATTVVPTADTGSSAVGGARRPSTGAQYVIYIGFVVVFVFFAVTLARPGLPDPQQPAQHLPPDRDHHGHGRGHDVRHRVRRRSTCRSARSRGSPRSPRRWPSRLRAGAGHPRRPR